MPSWPTLQTCQAIKELPYRLTDKTFQALIIQMAH